MDDSSGWRDMEGQSIVVDKDEYDSTLNHHWNIFGTVGSYVSVYRQQFSDYTIFGIRRAPMAASQGHMVSEEIYI